MVIPAYGPDFITQLQGFVIFVDSPAAGSVISYNDISNNDAGMGVFGNSECCKIDHNTLTNNRFFGIIVGEGEHTISNTKISLVGATSEVVFAPRSGETAQSAILTGNPISFVLPTPAYTNPSR
jgi:hypothetical protein